MTTPPTTVAPPATTVPPTTATTAPPATTAPTTTPPGSTLARTGANVLAVAATGIVVALAGGLLLGYATRRWPAAFYGW